MSVAFKLATNSNDKILLCYAPTPDKTNFVNTLQAKVEEEMENKEKNNWEFICLEPTYD